jgi:hypothetical protein
MRRPVKCSTTVTTLFYPQAFLVDTAFTRKRVHLLGVELPQCSYWIGFLVVLLIMPNGTVISICLPEKDETTGEVIYKIYDIDIP